MTGPAAAGADAKRAGARSSPALLPVRKEHQNDLSGSHGQLRKPGRICNRSGGYVRVQRVSRISAWTRWVGRRG
jgi:hypothetical protein